MARENTCQFAILGMLCREPMSGYGLRQAIEQTVGHFWQESYGNLYPTLERMEAEGWPRSTGRNTRQAGGCARCTG
ncbi:PadR family transcriptional regulator [Archangium minus]|uniref:PadR family transcriptional regulator n=1 Tax=Archangium minus TaxID=83450 RepID=UPI0037C0871F